MWKILKENYHYYVIQIHIYTNSVWFVTPQCYIWPIVWYNKFTYCGWAKIYATSMKIFSMHVLYEHCWILFKFFLIKWVQLLISQYDTLPNKVGGVAGIVVSPCLPAICPCLCRWYGFCYKASFRLGLYISSSIGTCPVSWSGSLWDYKSNVFLTVYLYIYMADMCGGWGLEWNPTYLLTLSAYDVSQWQGINRQCCFPHS